MPTQKVKTEHAGERVDVFINRFTDTSRSQVQKSIKQGEVTINDHTIKPHTLVQEGDLVFFPTTLRMQPLEKKGPLPSLTILYEDDAILVIEKQAGVIVHEVHILDQEQSLADALVAYCPEIKEVGDDPSRPGIVHRLDRQVSGVMVIAKTSASFSHLKQQFKDRTIKKEYLALVYGELPKDHDVITLKIARSKTLGRMVARPEDQEGKEAITEYTVLERYKIATFVKINIHTGRTHQIRAHFKAVDHPIVGDPLYKKKMMKNIHPIKMDRLFLHAHKLTITLMDGTQRTFESPLPLSLQNLLQTLSKN
ncbi:MAG: Pseudouridine synthase [Candidatus Uhrbacteria bacterium GW2011_GWE2_40_58]|nr:MAG: Pseudouridine synthase [Candidatus Uhrbacteria bacterium GW2011_GWF2_40_263]KKR67640.1 MAG: Pseudouridine synthase [Candidatus Uhrbacteria bacterium GW2011_GWE2_40_58]OGL94432.1 MAG: hypothetical protein A2239_01970 [Candidatus Uhrbacteria bacterium RIFOXYA2_FULL_40_9]OGL96678.1 MAG: hypothetical protein A2332_05140 [Candidatus Uhrbacteria bacterium RIFOXYB2_FULL_41_18]HBK34707.1 RluA family pseudouridine synthase [Candidatus Uhrbacteria bacterium]